MTTQLENTAENTEPDDFWHGWNAAYDDERFDESASTHWQRGYSEAQSHQAADDAEIAL